MKKIYSLVFLVFFAFALQAQTFDFSISFLGTNTGTDNYQFALVATPSASVTSGVTADMGAGFYVPSGLTIGNFAEGDSGISSLEWSSFPLGSDASGDGFFLSRVEIFPTSNNLDGPGPFQLVLFDVIADPNPTTGSLTLMENGNALMVANFVENYININLGAGTVNAYAQNDPAASSVDFSALLGVDEISIKEVSFKAYPIPTNDIVTIENPSNMNFKYSVKNMVGQDMGINGTLRSNGATQISLSQLDTAIYFISITDGNNKKSIKVITK
ncbi:MAG: T9SS type A sorting domain-containing protein [Flavobacteriaceae bacterium]|nr:T9SS type A sorting domain-containing protein [Flavobacteriaceae bacterium]